MKKEMALILCLFGFATNAFAEGVVGVKKGHFSTSMDGDPFLNLITGQNQGSITEFNFNWGDKDKIEFLGNVSVQSDNNSSLNYALGVAKGNFRAMYREYHMKDRVTFLGNATDRFSWDPLVASHPLGDIDSKAKEISFMFGSNNDNLLMLSYMESNFPNTISALGTTYDTYLDLKPKVESLTLGVHFDGLRKNFESNNSGVGLYLDGDIGIGFERVTQSSQVYSTKFGNSAKGNANVAQDGIVGSQYTNLVIKDLLEMGLSYKADIKSYPVLFHAGLWIRFDITGPVSGTTANGTELDKTSHPFQKGWLIGVMSKF